MILDKLLPSNFKRLITGAAMKKINHENKFSRYLVPEPVMIPRK
jgi:hypothetical protein